MLSMDRSSCIYQFFIFEMIFPFCSFRALSSGLSDTELFVERESESHVSICVLCSLQKKHRLYEVSFDRLEMIAQFIQ